ncbi:MAG: hypothetical protein P8X77_15400, partial [Maritimibacter sp.]
EKLAVSAAAKPAVPTRIVEARRIFFISFSLVFLKGAPQSRGIRIEYAASSLFGRIIASAPIFDARLCSGMMQQCHS